MVHVRTYMPQEAGSRSSSSVALLRSVCFPNTCTSVTIRREVIRYCLLVLNTGRERESERGREGGREGGRERER